MWGDVIADFCEAHQNIGDYLFLPTDLPYLIATSYVSQSIYLRSKLEEPSLPHHYFSLKLDSFDISLLDGTASGGPNMSLEVIYVVRHGVS